MRKVLASILIVWMVLCSVQVQSAFAQEDEQINQVGSLVCGSPCWLIYDALIGSWAGVLNESITLASILVSIRRYGWKEMGSSDSGF